jgi:hypothetical protein
VDSSHVSCFPVVAVFSDLNSMRLEL